MAIQKRWLRGLSEPCKGRLICENCDVCLNTPGSLLKLFVDRHYNLLIDCKFMCGLRVRNCSSIDRLTARADNRPTNRRPLPLNMMKLSKVGVAGFCILTLTALSACSGSSNGDAADLVVNDAPETVLPPEVETEVDAEPVGAPDQPTSEQPTGAETEEDSADPVVVVPPQSETPDLPAAPEAPEASNNDDSSASNNADDAVAPPSATGSDLSAGEDDSIVAAETASLVGPFIKDTSRSAGPPSVPQDLTLLLAGETWMEFTWAPSSDDQSVEAYEVYRDGQLLATVRGDTGYEFDYRSWLSTSYIDCNYTRYATCGNVQPVPGTTYSYSVVAIDNEGMRSANSAPALFTLAERGSAAVDLSTYTKVFGEEFDGTVLDRSRWKTALPWGPDTTINSETQYFVNIFGSEETSYDPFVFTGETLQITGIDTPPELLAESNNKPYLSGVLTTSDNFAMTYGYVEMNAKLAGGEGLLSTFFLFNQDFEKNKPEIDIIEYIGSRPDKAYQTYHYFDSNRARTSTGERHSSPTMETVYPGTLSDGFHTYGVLWEPGFVAWYIDDVEVRRLTGPRVSDEPMNIITQLVIGSEWIGTPAASSIPAILEIDYIRAWQQQ